MEEKAAILKSAFGHPYRNNEEYLFKCPECNHSKNKLSVNIAKNVFKCWVCDFTGKDIGYLLKKHAPLRLRQRWNSLAGKVDIRRYDDLFEEAPPVSKQVIELPKGFKTLTGPVTGSIKSKPLNYLYSRDLNDSDIVRWKMGYCDYGPYRNRVIIPSFDTAGDLNYFIARSYTGDSYKYKNPQASKDIVFNDLNIDWDNDIILVEGVFDAVRLKNAIPLLGSSLRENSKLFEKICIKRPNVYVALDPDAREKELHLIKKLRDRDIQVFDASVFGYDDIAEMPRKELPMIKRNACFVTDAYYLGCKIAF